MFAHEATRPTSSASTNCATNLLLLRRAVQPLQEVCNRIMRFDVRAIDHAMNDYFRESRTQSRWWKASTICATCSTPRWRRTCCWYRSTDHVTKTLDRLGRDPVHPLAIASIYGMNFKMDARARASLGYPIVMSVMIGLCGYLLYRFRNAGWI